MQTVTVTVTVPHSGLRPRYLEITGLNMEMGINRVQLKEVGGGQQWRGETIIPVCSQREMHWRASLVLQRGDERFRLDDEFRTRRH